MDNGVIHATATAPRPRRVVSRPRRRVGVLLRLAGWLAPVLALGPLVAVSTSPPTLSRGPYLQLITRTSVTVVWHTDGPGVCGLEIQPVGSREPTRITGETASSCVVTAEGLRPGREYSYVPQADGIALTSSSEFRTDDPNLPYAFLVFGDSGSGDEEQLVLADRMAHEPVDFILHTGDLIYPDALPEEWDPKFFRPYGDLLRRVVLWPAVGNHDVGADDGLSWQDVFHTPANNASGNERYYSFRYGNARVVVLDTYDDLDPGSAQYAFLVGELGASTATWKFVLFHDTIYSSGSHGSDESIRSDLVPVFDEFGVDLVFMGHDHHYERTWLLRGDAVVAANEGTIYVTTGGGGATLRDVGTSDFTAYAESTYHFVRVAVDGGLLHLEMARADGSVGDTLTLLKELPMTLEVVPVADTYIEAGAEAAWDHGGSQDLKVDADPERIAYLKFDLRRLRTDIRSARLSLFATNGSADGGTIYPMLDSTWNEGAGDGTTSGAGGTGLKWTDVDTNGDGAVDELDGSRYLPDFSRPLAFLGPVTDGERRTVDVTGAFRHRGAGTYSLAIPTLEDNGATYAAREHESLGRPPLLLIELSEGVCGNAVVEPGEECDDADCCTACAVDRPGAPCVSDGRFCTGIEACSERGDCESAGNPCAGGGACTAVCDEQADTCISPAGTPCGDDGLFCTADVCDGAGACVHTAVAECPVVTDAASPRARSDCYVALAGLAPGRGGQVVCEDGDPGCDRDGRADGGCTFELRVCALQTDLPGCAAGSDAVIERITVKPKKARLALPALPATGPACGVPTRVYVPLKKGGTRAGALTLTLQAVARSSRRKDRDTLVLRCLRDV